MNKLKLHSAKEFLRYRLSAGNAHGLHSPFVFDLYNNVIKDDMPFYTFDPIEFLRTKLLANKTPITIHDLGAGGEKNSHRQTTIANIASRSLSPAKYGRLLFRLTNHFRPKTIIELGTSLGVSTLFLSLPSSESKVYTIEGSPEIHQFSKSVFHKFNRTNIQSLLGDFDSVLPDLIKKLDRIDMAFIDGNHRYEPTVNYFKILLEKTTADSLLIFDDIHWSEEMTKAWKEIQNHPKVTISIDLYRMGIVFFRSGVPKQHFILRY